MTINDPMTNKKSPPPRTGERPSQKPILKYDLVKSMSGMLRRQACLPVGRLEIFWLAYRLICFSRYKLAKGELMKK